MLPTANKASTAASSCSSSDNSLRHSRCFCVYVLRFCTTCKLPHTCRFVLVGLHFPKCLWAACTQLQLGPPDWENAVEKKKS